MNSIKNYNDKNNYHNLLIRLLKDITTYFNEVDLKTNGNIISEKYILSKKKFFLGEYNPEYDFSITGKSVFNNDLKINGNLILDKNSKILDSYKKKKIYLTSESNTISGISIINKETTAGIFFENNRFILSNEFDIEDSKQLYNLELNKLNCNNIELDNLYLDTINGKNNKIKINSNIEINGEIYSNDVLNINTDLSVNNINCKNIKFNILNGNNCTINIGNIENFKSNNVIINNSLKICDNIFEKDKIILRSSLNFSNEINSPIIFNKLTNIDNLSCNYVNNKRVLNDGEIVTTNNQQILTNKSFNNNINMKNNKIINVSNPINNHDVATKEYVDSCILKLNVLEPVVVLCYENLKFNGKNGNNISIKKEKLIIDNYELSINDRILLSNQLNNNENGIYQVISIGGFSQHWIIRLSDDYKKKLESKSNISYVVYVTNGKKNFNKLYSINFEDNKIFQIGFKNNLNYV